MGCNSTACRDCGNHFPACQLVDGLCVTCRTKQQVQQPIVPTPPPDNAKPKTH